MADDVRQPDLPDPSWSDETSALESLRTLHKHARMVGQGSIDWYHNHKWRNKFFARSLRLSAILCTAAGGAVPLLVTAGLLPSHGGAESGGANYSSAGYLLLALAGTCIVLDRFFGFSSAWIRYMTTAMTLQQRLAEFDFEWARLTSNTVGMPPTARNEQLLAFLQSFVTAVLSAVAAETNEWAAEFRTTLAETDKAAQEKSEAWRPGSINVIVPNAADFPDGIEVELDGRHCQTLRTSFCQLSPVDRGEHLVTAYWISGEQRMSKSERVQVGASQAVTVVFGLKADKPADGSTSPPTASRQEPPVIPDANQVNPPPSN